MDAFQLPSLSPVISSVIFMFFVSFALAYTFGVTYAEKTENLLVSVVSPAAVMAMVTQHVGIFHKSTCVLT